MGSIDKSDYSVLKETHKIFIQGILNNPLVPTLPWELKAAGRHVKFLGNDIPSIPINWRFAESSAALKAFEAIMLDVLRYRKYGSRMSEFSIDTDHASLFIMSPLLTKVVVHGETKDSNFLPGRYSGETKDGKYYHIHGSMNPEPTLNALGMDPEGNLNEDYDTVAKQFQEIVSKHDAKDLDTLMNDKYKQAGTICHSTEEFKQTEHGKANANVGLYELTRSSNHNQAAGWWPDHESFPSSQDRPLASLIVLDLTRVIAAPALTRGLAEMGASVMRVTSPHVTDLSGVHQDLNWGKWTTLLHLKDEEDRKKLTELIKDADVVVEGYRPGVMEKYGLSREDIFELMKDRERGIIHVKDNCYGWHGSWKGRSGWQQISDACCGVSLAYGRAMGLDEAVTPVFPNSDYCTGIIGTTAVLHALIRRADEGGSFGVNVALNYYSQWLVDSIGEYPKDVWTELWQRHNSPVFRCFHNMQYDLPSMLGLLQQYDAETLLKPGFFEKRRSEALGVDFLQLKPVAQ